MIKNQNLRLKISNFGILKPLVSYNSMWHLNPQNPNKSWLIGYNNMWDCFHHLIIRCNKWKSSYGYKCFMINNFVSYRKQKKQELHICSLHMLIPIKKDIRETLLILHDFTFEFQMYVHTKKCLLSHFKKKLILRWVIDATMIKWLLFQQTIVTCIISFRFPKKHHWLIYQCYLGL